VAKKLQSSGELTANTRIAALVGKEHFLQLELTQQLKQLLEKAHGEVAVFRFDGLSAQLADILDECRTFGLMAQYKLVIVDNADQVIKEDNRPLMERYACAPCDSATLILRTDKWHAGKLDDLICKVGTIIRCEAKTHHEAAAWALANCQRRHNATIEKPAAELLVNRIGTDLGRLDTELEKLAVSATTDPTKPAIITMRHVADMVGLTREEEAWVVQDSLLSGNPAASIGHIHTILENSRRDANIPLAWACLDLARKLNAAAQGLSQGANPWSLGGKLKLWPESRKEAILNIARRVPPHRLAALLNDAVAADFKQKTGGGDPDRLLEVLALRFAQTLQRS
jgi:DNA polymerase III subunit delta